MRGEGLSGRTGQQGSGRGRASRGRGRGGQELFGTWHFAEHALTSQRRAHATAAAGARMCQPFTVRVPSLARPGEGLRRTRGTEHGTCARAFANLPVPRVTQAQKAAMSCPHETCVPGHSLSHSSKHCTQMNQMYQHIIHEGRIPLATNASAHMTTRPCKGKWFEHTKSDPAKHVHRSTYRSKLDSVATRPLTWRHSERQALPRFPRAVTATFCHRDGRRWLPRARETPRRRPSSWR